MSQRPRRAPKPPPLSYWEEFVETDKWYLKKIVEDVPEEELHAALYDEDYSHGEDALSGDESEEEDESGSEVDLDYMQVEQEDIAISDGVSESDDGSGDDSDSASDEDEEVYGSSEGECGSEGTDGESTGSTVGEGGTGAAEQVV